MPILFRDIETRSTLDLKEVGAWRYAADPTTEVLCVGYCVDDGAVQIWTPGQPIPDEFIAAARDADDPTWLIVAHNDSFETAIETRLLHPRFGWPLAPIELHRCTMARALASALPGSLEGAAAALGLPIEKDREGYRLMMQMAKPRKARKGEDPNVIHWHDDPERRLRLAEYCKRDVELERLLYRRLPPLSVDEQILWVLDAKINVHGFHVDLELAEAARSIVHAEQEAIDRELTKITDGKVTSINQVAKLTALLKDHGHNVTGLTKRSVAAVLAHDPLARGATPPRAPPGGWIGRRAQARQPDRWCRRRSAPARHVEISCRQHRQVERQQISAAEFEKGREQGFSRGRHCRHP